MHFTLKFVKSLQVSQFHEIFHTNFWRVFDVWPNLVSEAVFLASIKVSSNSHNFRFRSQHGLHIKICQIVAGQSISQNFPIYFSAGFLCLAQLCVGGCVSGLGTHRLLLAICISAFSLNTLLFLLDWTLNVSEEIRDLTAYYIKVKFTWRT